MVLIFSSDEVIWLLKLISTNNSFNNQDVDVYIRTDLSENRVSLQTIKIW